MTKVYTVLRLGVLNYTRGADVDILLTTTDQQKATNTLIREIQNYIDSWYDEDEPRTREEYLNDFWETTGKDWLFREDVWYAQFKIVETELM